ncbi:MAG: CBS domain-containing protein, partial [Cyanobacteria bacterium J06636_16]
MNQGGARSFSSSQVSTSDSGQTGSNRSSYALVMIDEQLVGIFTERDVVRLTSQGIDLADRAIGDVMTQSLVTLQASDLQDPSAVLHRFRKHRIRHLPVLNEQQQVVGVATQRSIRQTLQSADLLRLRRVREVMSTQVISAPPEATVLELASTMATHRVSCVVITQSTELITGSKLLPIGIVTERDIVQFQALGLDLSIQAQAVMSTPLQCLQPEDDLWAAHQTMDQLHVRRLVVADSHGTLAGILTQTSVLAALDPLEMQHTIAFLREQVDRLQDERLQWLEAHASQLENQVQATEQRYSNLAEAAPVGIFQADISGNCTYVNSLWCQIVGVLPEEAIGIGWFQNIHPEDQYSVGIAWRYATETKQPFRLEYRFQTPSGQVTWVFGQAVAETGSDGEISGYIGTITDITERKQAETALQASEARLKEAQQIAQIGNWELDLRTNTL